MEMPPTAGGADFHAQPAQLAKVGLERGRRQFVLEKPQARCATRTAMGAERLRKEDRAGVEFDMVIMVEPPWRRRLCVRVMLEVP